MWLPTKNTPRWLIFSIDMVIVCLSFVIAYLVRFEFAIPSLEVELAILFFPILLITRATSFLVGKTYAGIIRYTSTQDTTRIFLVLTAGSLLFAGLNQVKYHFYDHLYFVPNSIIILDYLLTLFAMVVSRITIKVLYLELKTPDKTLKRAIIFWGRRSRINYKTCIRQRSTEWVRCFCFC
jgi:FlaA1/EpsC-like NDP-sugar epimerase